MPTDFDIEMLPEVTEMIADVGVSGVFDTDDNAAVNAEDGEVYNPLPTSYTWRCTPVVEYDRRLNTSEEILANDGMVVVAGENIPFNPQVMQRLTVNGEKWKIVAASPVWSGEQIAAYILQVRR